MDSSDATSANASAGCPETTEDRHAVGPTPGTDGSVEWTLDVPTYSDSETGGGPEGLVAHDFDTLARVMAGARTGPCILPDGGMRDLWSEVWVSNQGAVGLFGKVGRIDLALEPSAHVETMLLLEREMGKALFADQLMVLIEHGLHGAQGLQPLIDEIGRGGSKAGRKHHLLVQCWAGHGWLVGVTVILRRTERGLLMLAPVGGEMDHAATRAAEIAAEEVRNCLARHCASGVSVLMGVP